MKVRWKKITAYAVVSLVVLLAAGISFTIGWRPIIGAKARSLTDRKFEATPARLERGRYLAENVLGCFDCHSQRDREAAGAPAIADKRGAGQVFLEGNGFPGRLVAPNITPDAETGAGTWTDDMLARAIREGIGHDGRALFPIMPYQNFRQLSDEDLASVVAYLRTVRPVNNALPKTDISFPVNLLIKSAPEPIYTAVPEPDKSDRLKYGGYVTRIAGCGECHTPDERGQPKKGLEFAGGRDFEGVASANITSDASGISYYDEEMFLEVMRTGRVKARQLHPIMPWVFYKNMTDEDLKAIFAYIRSLPAVKHRVDNSEPVTDCRVCGLKHGGGSLN